MRWLVLLLVVVACEKASDGRFAIGWEPPTAGEQIVVTSQRQMTVGGRTYTQVLHAVAVHTQVDGDWIRATTETIGVANDGVEQPSVAYVMSAHEPDPDIRRADGQPLADAERRSVVDGIRLTFADPAPRKRFVLHRFAIGERYHLAPDECEALAMRGGDITIVLRAAHGDKLTFDLDGTMPVRNESMTFHGHLETDGPNYRYFHKVLDGTVAEPYQYSYHLDHLQARPSDAAH